MSESEVNPRELSLSELMDQIIMEYKGYRIGFFVLLVHAGKISFKDAYKALQFEPDRFAAICEYFNVVVNEEDDDEATCEEDEPTAGEPQPR